MSEYEKKSLSLQEQILVESRKQREISTEVYVGNERIEKATFMSAENQKKVLKTVTKAVAGITLGLYTFNKQFRDRAKEVQENAMVRLDIARDTYKEGLYERELTKPRQAKLEKFLVKAFKPLLVAGIVGGLLKGLSKAMFRLGEFILSPILKLGKILKLDKILTAPLKLIYKGIVSLGDFVRDNFLKLALAVGALLYFFKTDNKFISEIRSYISETLSSLTASLFGVKDTGSFLNTFKQVWKEQWLPTLNEGWFNVVQGVKKWWYTDGQPLLNDGWQFLFNKDDGVITAWWKEDGLPAIKSTFDKIYAEIANFAELQKNKFLYGTEEAGGDDLGSGVTGAIIGAPDAARAAADAYSKGRSDAIKAGSPFANIIGQVEGIKTFTKEIGTALLPKFVDTTTGEVKIDTVQLGQNKENRKKFFDGLIKFFSPDPTVVDRSTIFGSREYMARPEPYNFGARLQAAGGMPGFGNGMGSIIYAPGGNTITNVQAPTYSNIFESKKIIDANPVNMD